MRPQVWSVLVYLSGKVSLSRSSFCSISTIFNSRELSPPRVLRTVPVGSPRETT